MNVGTVPTVPHEHHSVHVSERGRSERGRGWTCVFQKSSAIQRKKVLTVLTMRRRMTYASLSRTKLSHTRRPLVSEEATTPYQWESERLTGKQMVQPRQLSASLPASFSRRKIVLLSCQEVPLGMLEMMSPIFVTCMLSKMKNAGV